MAGRSGEAADAAQGILTTAITPGSPRGSRKAQISECGSRRRRANKQRRPAGLRTGVATVSSGSGARRCRGSSARFVNCGAVAPRIDGFRLGSLLPQVCRLEFFTGTTSGPCVTAGHRDRVGRVGPRGLVGPSSPAPRIAPSRRLRTAPPSDAGDARIGDADEGGDKFAGIECGFVVAAANAASGSSLS
jgi:hypothetical protein